MQKETHMADNLLLPLSLDRLVDANGAPLGGGKVFVYEAGTTNLRNVFSDNALTVAAANPIVADAGGYIEPRYIGTGDYRLVITDASDVTIKTADNLTGALATAAFENDEATPVTPVIVKSANYTVQTGDKGKVIHADATGASLTITLLSAATAGDNFRITIKHTGNANEVTVGTSGGDTLDGTPSFLLDAQNETITCVSGGANWSIASDAGIFTAPLPVGVVLPFAGTNVPNGWFLCDGSAISRTGNSVLFGVVGTTYGGGDGSTTFNLPDLRGRVPAGKETSASRLTSGGSGVDGATGGAETHMLTEAELASHTHGDGSYAAADHNHDISTRNHTTTSGSDGSRLSEAGSSGATDTFFGMNNAGTLNVSGTSDATGSDASHNNTQPTIILNYIIKAT